MEKTITLGRQTYTYKVTTKLSYDFLKYRNRITKGYDFTKADKDVVEEIVAITKDTENFDSMTNLELMEKLTPKARTFLVENKKMPSDIFSYDELIEVTTRLTGIEDKDKVENILDLELEQSTLDDLVAKISTAVAEVFTNAKYSSTQA